MHSSAVRTLGRSQQHLWPRRPVDKIDVPIEVPDSHPSDPTLLDNPSDVCPQIATPLVAALPHAALSSATDGDLRIYATARPNPDAAPGQSTTCHRDVFGRPVVAHTNVHAPLVTYLHGESARGGAAAATAAALLQRVLEHEMMHVLALQWGTLAQFRDASRRIRGTITDSRLVRGDSAQYLVTPHATYAIRQHYAVSVQDLQGSSVLPGLEIGGSATSLDPDQVCTHTCAAHLSRSNTWRNANLVLLSA
jgi:hypothetical protein